MNLANRARITTGSRKGGKKKGVLIRLQSPKDLWELQALGLEVIGSTPDLVAIDPDGTGIIEYFDEHVPERTLSV